jgi:hypothetical protein
LASASVRRRGDCAPRGFPEASGNSARLAVQEDQAEANSRGLGLRLALMTLRLLEHWRSHLGVDHDSALIILATAAITMEKFTRLDFDPELKDIRSAMPSELLTRCNISSIAAATGLNRETTRRKVQALAKAGVLLTDRKGSFRLSPDYTLSVGTTEMLRSQLQTVVRATNELLKDGILQANADAGA